MTSATYPDTIFETSIDWGDYAYLDLDMAEKTIEGLRQIGEGWEDVSIDECDTFSLVDAQQGIYRLDGTPKDHYYKATKIEDGVWKMEDADYTPTL